MDIIDKILDQILRLSDILTTLIDNNQTDHNIFFKKLMEHENKQTLIAERMMQLENEIKLLKLGKL
ncbi:MAG: hypothetical protein WC179_09730 [Candidatus Cloacimonadaceae bacterium]